MANLSDFIPSGLSGLDVRTIGQTSSDITLDLSQNTVFEFEPTADITVNITGLASSGRAIGYINGTSLGAFSITWKVDNNADNALLSNISALSAPYKVELASRNFNTLDGSGEDSEQKGVAWNNDGTKIYLIGNSNDNVYEYDVTTDFNVATASFSKSFSINGGFPKDVVFNDDGSKMFTKEFNNNKEVVAEYDVSTKFDVSSASFSQSFSLENETGTAGGIAFNSDGTKLFVADNSNDRVLEYTLTTGFDLSTESFNQSFNTNQTNPVGLTFSADGTKMLVTYSGSEIEEYDLSTGFDISTASLSFTKDLSGLVTNADGLTWGDSGRKLYVLDGDNETVVEFDVPQFQSINIQQFDANRALIGDF